MQRNRKTTFFAITLLIGGVIVFHYLGWLLPFERVLRSIVNRGSDVAYTQSLSFQEESFDSVDALYVAYRELKVKAEERDAFEARLKESITQNDKLREELHFLQPLSYTYVSADVIGKNVDPVANTLLVNSGTNQGLAVGNPVIAFEGVYVGKVIRADADTSIVRLLQDGQSKVAATLLNEERSIGLIEGGYGVSVHMNLIPENEHITIGDMVITSGLEKGIPRGLLIGTVSSLKKEAYEPFQQAIVTPSLKTNFLDTVVVITNAV